MSHPGCSAEQIDAETWLRAELSRQLGVELVPQRVSIGGKVTVDLDGVDPDAAVACEIYARIGALKAGQKHKLSTDLRRS